MYSNKKMLKMISVIAIIAVMILPAMLSGCSSLNNGPMTELEIEKKQNSMLLSLDDFKFGEYTCTGANPKFIVKVDSATPYYILPSSDEIVIPNGLEMHMYLGEPYLQPLRPSETIDVPEGSVRTITIILSSKGQDITVRGMVANLGDDPVPMYVGFPNIEGVQYFDGDHHEIDLRSDDVYPEYGENFKFMIGLAEDYNQSIITVKINGEVVTPDDDGIYTIFGIDADSIIEIDGVKHN